MRRSAKTEALILFSVIFLPAYLFQPGRFPGSIFGEPMFYIQYALKVIPAVALMIYLIPSDERYGLKLPAASLFFKDLCLILGSLGALQILISLILTLFPEGTIPPPLMLPAEFSPVLLAPAFFLFLMTGYFEELFFRSYLLTRMEEWGAPPLTGAVIGSILFAAGHLSQGVSGLITTFFLGMILSAFWFRSRNLHTLAWSHGIFNTVVLALTWFTNK